MPGGLLLMVVHAGHHEWGEAIAIGLGQLCLRTDQLLCHLPRAFFPARELC